jgi:hypothetical protein
VKKGAAKKSAAATSTGRAAAKGVAMKGASPEDVISAAPPDRGAALAAVRDVILENLPAGYEEAVVKGMLSYQVPLSVYPDTYNGHALMYVALAAQKSYNTLYLMSAYGYAEHLKRLSAGFAAAGKKLDMGKSCIHFKKTDELALDVIGELIADIPVDRWVAIAKAARVRK